MRRSQLAYLAVLVAVSAVGLAAWLFPVPADPQRSPREAAEQLLAECRWRDTVEACDALLGELPDDGEIWFWRGRGQYALGDYEAAAADFSEAITRLPRDAEPRYFRAMVHERLGNRELAEADLDAARLLDPNKDKLRLALRDEEAAKAVRGVVREANRTAEARSTQRQSARANLANKRVAALHESSEAQASLPNDRGQDKTGDAPRASAVAEGDSAFARLTSPASVEKRFGDLLALSSTPEELLGPLAAFPGKASSPSVIQEPGGLGGGVVPNEPNGQESLDRVAEPAFDRIGGPRDALRSGAAPHESAAEIVPPLSAWEQFQRRRSALTAGGALSTPQLATTPFASRKPEISERSDSELGDSGLSNDALPARTSKYPVRSWTAGILPAPGVTSKSAVGPLGPLGALASAGQPLSTAQPSPYPQRGPENALSTALIPLPTPAVDMSAAIASAPPGILSMAIQELFSPSAANAKPPLATFTAPLPEWIAPPASAAPKRP
jgi:tetratricopeptide (TPR) repeat protein